MFGIAAAIYVYCTYVFVENKNLKPEIVWEIWLNIVIEISLNASTSKM